MIWIDTEHEVRVQTLALQLAGISTRQINTHLGGVSQPAELALGLPQGVELYCTELQRYGAEAEAILRRCAELGIGVHASGEASYPSALWQILGMQCPPILYSLGDECCLDSEARVAVIGTRQPDAEGLRCTREVASRLASSGAVIVSGLARGCDGEAHRCCLEVGGRGIAVVATGLDEVYPREHTSLQQALLRHGGLILSEYPPETHVDRRRLVIRDRLLAAISTQVIVTQCGLGSGTLHAVRFARRYGVPCFALSYDHYSPERAGNHWLLTEGLAERWE